MTYFYSKNELRLVYNRNTITVKRSFFYLILLFSAIETSFYRNCNANIIFVVNVEFLL
jgi:hypothetical protein